MSLSAAEKPIEAPAVEPAASAAPAEASAAAAAHADHAWVWQVTALSAVLGVMLALAINTTSRIKESGLPWKGLGISAEILSTYRKQNESLQEEIKSLRGHMGDLEQTAKGNSD